MEPGPADARSRGARPARPDRRLILLAATLLAWTAACGKEEQPEAYVYTLPEQLDDDLPVGSLSDVGIEVAPVEGLVDGLRQGRPDGVDSVLVLRGGRLVLEEYFRAWNRDLRHPVASCTKSVVSALVGVAWDAGLVPDLEERVFSYFPDYSRLEDPLKDEIRLTHLLTMTSGLEWDQTVPAATDVRAMLASPDWIEYVLARPMAARPGDVWNYCGGATELLAGILERTTGLHGDRMADLHLFGPLGVTDYEWEKHRSGLVNADFGLSMRPRDMAKLGLLYLNHGRWRDRQVLSEAWVDLSTQERVRLSSDVGYAYQWWSMHISVGERRIAFFTALGNGGQRIQVFPTLDLVLVFTQSFYDRSDLSEYLLGSILPAVTP
jgi:CubicO group peptidase (beta-lactamase class C family)